MKCEGYLAMLNSDCGCVKCVFDSASLRRYEDCDFLYFEPASVSKITEGMKTNFDSRHTGRKKEKKKKKKKKPEMCRNNEISWCFLGRYGMMQTDAQLTSSPKDTDTRKTQRDTHTHETNAKHLTATSKRTNLHVCMHSHTLSHYLNAWNSNVHVLTCSLMVVHKHKLISWLVQMQTCMM